jgi:hypothetical protein
MAGNILYVTILFSLLTRSTSAQSQTLKRHAVRTCTVGTPGAALKVSAGARMAFLFLGKS